MNCRFDATASISVFIAAASLVMLAAAAYPQDAVVESNHVAYVTYGVSPGSPFSSPSCIFFDKILKESYIADSGNQRIVICDINGMPIHSFYHRLIQNGRTAVGEPKSVVVNSEGQIFLTDAKVSYIDILDPLGRSIDRISPVHEGCGKGGRFDFLGLGPGDEIFATLSCEKNHLMVIGPDPSITRMISLDSPGQRQFCASAIAISESGEIVIAYPCAEVMIQIFSAEGKFLNGFGKHATGLENFSFPAGIALMSNGDIWIADAIRQIASRFSRDGRFLSYIGGKGVEPGAFRYPSGIASDGDKLLFVLERVGQRYQCFKLAGNDKRVEKIKYSLSKSAKTSKSN